MSHLGSTLLLNVKHFLILPSGTFTFINEAYLYRYSYYEIYLYDFSQSSKMSNCPRKIQKITRIGKMVIKVLPFLRLFLFYLYQNFYEDYKFVILRNFTTVKWST